MRNSAPNKVKYPFLSFLKADKAPKKQTSYSYFEDTWARLLKNKLAMTGLYALIVLMIAAIFVPIFCSHSYHETNLPLKNLPPCSNYWFGTDELGRDIFVRIFYGARISLFIGIAAATLDIIIGMIYGAISALIGGKTDEIMMRATDILYSLPLILIVIMMIVFFGAGIFTIIIALTLTGWINMARIIRGQVLQLKEQDFVKASLLFGASKKRILFFHLIPNCIGSILTTLTFTIPAAIFTEAFLSFLGLGVKAPIASWGTMASDGLSAMRYYPWRLIFPAFFITITMLGFNMLGDGLRDASDPRLKS